MTEQQPWQWDEPTWRGHVEHVRAGRPESWPGGARVAVALSFDSDHETIPLRDGEVLPGKLSQGEYGARVGVPWILKLLERFEAPSTQLLEVYGAGPDTAAALLIAAGDNPDRLHSQASFAALCGVSPIQASSGKTQRHRLNRGGDRQANCALHTIALTRIRWDPRTRDYLERRLTEGKTRREAIRCLKRYIAREIYQLIRSTQTPHPAA